MFKKILIILFLIFVVSVYGTANMTGYSGAPGTQGTCAGKCHGSSNGTIVVEGFPKTYVPGQTYVITVRHTSGSKISNFNASVRIGTTKKYAGIISADYQTSTYSIAAESNGVHLTAANKDTGIFNWTAPQPGNGDVNLYLSGMQGTIPNGQNTNIMMTSNQAQTYAEGDTNAISYLALQVQPLIVKDSAAIEINVPNTKTARLKILDNKRQLINMIEIPESANPPQTIIWKPIDKDGKKLPDGSYIASLFCEDEQVIKNFVINSK